MKFIISSAVLQKQLSAISGVIASNPMIPILENFLFKIEKGTLTVSASDLNVSMTLELSVEADDDTAIAIPAKILLDTLKSLPEQPITFSINEENTTVEITSYSGRYKLTCEKADDFPKMPNPEKSIANTTIESAVLAKALNTTLFAVGTDEVRPAMTGVHIDISDKSTVFVATDGHKLIKYQREDVVLQGGENKPVIVPKKALSLVKAFLPTDSTDVKIEFSETHAFFTANNISLSSRLIDENFPDYENAIPLGNSNKLQYDRVEMLNALKRLDIYTNKSTHQIRLKLVPDQAVLSIFAEDLDFSNEANENVNATYEGEDMEIGFNARFLIEMLSTLDATRLDMTFSIPSRASIILPQENLPNEHILMLVMPVMLNTYA
ncbi:MAG: DNA polymerase III subunit beta [Cytophagales bacterium]|nr:MAG: DNA polymerase III subunit beta [Cytophagales bacterium]